MFKAILFDLDGTLLPMDMEEFSSAYFKLVTAKFAGLGYDPKKFFDALMAGTMGMIKNNGSCTNETVFWKAFADMLGGGRGRIEEIFTDYYKRDFLQLEKLCPKNPLAAKAVELAGSRAQMLVLATNPIFPLFATETRMRWNGISPDSFCCITSYETSGACKPNPVYYRELLEKIGCRPSECLMIGNDVDEDMAKL